MVFVMNETFHGKLFHKWQRARQGECYFPFAQKMKFKFSIETKRNVIQTRWKTWQLTRVDGLNVQPVKTVFNQIHTDTSTYWRNVHKRPTPIHLTLCFFFLSFHSFRLYIHLCSTPQNWFSRFGTVLPICCVVRSKKKKRQSVWCLN